MSHTHKHHSTSKDSASIEVHLKDRIIRVGRKWYALHEEFDRFGDEHEFFERVHRDGPNTRVGDRKLERKLWDIWNKEKEREEKRRKKKRKAKRKAKEKEEARRMRKLQNQVLEQDRRDRPAPDSEEDYAVGVRAVERPKQPLQASEADGEIKRNKYGIKLYSHFGDETKKIHLDVCVNNATKYRSFYSVRLFVAGKPWRYTFGKKEMRAFLREIARAFSPKELRELF